MKTLLEIGDERARHMEALEALLVEIGGDVSDEDVDAAITAWLNEADAPLKEKLDAYGAVIREKELLAAARKAEADRLTALARTDTNTVERLKDRLKLFLEAEGLQKFEANRFKFSISGNGGPPPLTVDTDDPFKLPSWAWKVEVSVDTEAIRDRLNKGEKLPFARFGKRGSHLRVR